MNARNNSMKTQNSISQAQQSLDRVHNSVAMAQSHPTEQMIEQAENSIERAERAAAKARDASNPDAAQLVESELRQEKENLESLQ